MKEEIKLDRDVITWTLIVFEKVPTPRMKTMLKKISVSQLTSKFLYAGHNRDKETAMSKVNEAMIKFPKGINRCTVMFISDRQFGEMKIFYTK